MSFYPSLYHPDDAFAGMYNARTEAFATEGRIAKLRPSSQDQRKVALVIVDAQWDFVHPDGHLSVPGSQEDIARLIEFIYRNAEDISSVYASLDSHQQYQIFYGSWWVDPQTGEHPGPYTIITMDDIARGKWQALIDPLWSHGKYLPTLKQHAQKDLMIWPEHTMIGTMGHNLMPALSEALAFHSTAKRTQVSFLVKGTVPQVEHYGIFAPEVQYAKHPNGGVNTAILDAIATNDLIYVAGEAKSHCVLETMKQLVIYFGNQPDVIRKIRFLVDCTSSVQHPQVDFETLAQAELQKMEKLGVQLVLSTDPIG